MFVYTYLERRKWLFYKYPKYFPSFTQIREVNYLLIIISCVYIMQRTGGFNATSLHHDFHHLQLA